MEKNRDLIWTRRKYKTALRGSNRVRITNMCFNCDIIGLSKKEFREAECSFIGKHDLVHIWL